MMRPAPLARCASMLVFLLLRPDGAAANLTTRIFVSSPLLGIATIEPTMNSVDGPLADDYHFDGAGPHGTGMLDAQVEVDYGVIRIITAGQIDADNYELDAVSSDSGLSADASFSDMVTISSVEYDGMLGTFVPVIRVTGELAGTASGVAIPFISFATANWLLNFASPNQQRSAICSGAADTGQPCQHSGNAFGTHTLNPVPFRFGSPFLMTVSISAGATQRTLPNSSTDVEANLGFTTTWMGFDGVFDEEQTPVESFSVTSDTGIDWSIALPEPGSGTSALVALLTLGVVRRIRGRASRSEHPTHWGHPIEFRPKVSSRLEHNPEPAE